MQQHTKPEPIKFTLEKTVSQDIQAIQDIARKLEIFTKEEVDCLQLDICNYLEDPEDPDLLFSVKYKGDIIGFLHFGPLLMTDRSWMLFWIIVSGKYRNHGIGSELIRFVEDYIRNQNGRMIFIETSDNDDFRQASNFYLRQGYELTATIAEYYGDNHSKSVFRKRL